MTESASPFGRTVKQWRERQAMSRSDLAQRAGLSYPYVSQLETGLRKPSREAARKIAAALDISVEDLERTIPSDPHDRDELLAAEATSALILSGKAGSFRSADPLVTRAARTSDVGDRDDLIGDIIDLLEEFPAEERLDVLAQVQKRAMKRMLDQTRLSAD
ncbi:MAG TPA: helix-turn-helix transcriptional regulator [Aeromicrobium sp.]|nr:helix-turn-helix transcriptional regulator [Aeromicrobium sp.]